MLVVTVKVGEALRVEHGADVWVWDLRVICARSPWGRAAVFQVTGPVEWIGLVGSRWEGSRAEITRWGPESGSVALFRPPPPPALVRRLWRPGGVVCGDGCVLRLLHVQGQRARIGVDAVPAVTVTRTRGESVGAAAGGRCDA